MKVQIKGDISGSRDGAPWPKRGETMELPDDEGAQLCASGLAVPVSVKDADAEKAVPDDVDVEGRSGGLTKATAGAVTPDGSGEPKSESDGDQAAAESKDQAPAPAPAKQAAATARKTAAAKKTAAPATAQTESK